MTTLFKIVDGEKILLTPEETVAWLSLQETPEQASARLLQELTTAVQVHLDTTARSRNYDGILSACTYSSSSVPKFAAEGQACVLWRDAVWATCYAILSQVETGQRQPPTTSELLASLPSLTWPGV